VLASSAELCASRWHLVSKQVFDRYLTRSNLMGHMWMIVQSGACDAWVDKRLC
jgi:hypothetical protein